MKVSFAHNVHNRHKTLKDTILMERRFFPNSKVYVAYNTKDFNIKYFDDLDNIKFIFYNGKEHKIGCVNGCITSIKKALKDDSDIIVFSHDDVMINPNSIEILNKNLSKIKNNEFDIICRKPNTYGGEYLMMEGFYMNKKSANKIFSELKPLGGDGDIPKDGRKSPSPEVWLYKVLNRSDLNVKIIEYVHHVNNYNIVLAENLGLFHKNAGLRGWTD